MLHLLALKEIALGELNKVGRQGVLVEFELLGGVVMIKGSLPRDIRGGLDRKAVRARYFEETEVRGSSLRALTCFLDFY